MTTIHPFQEQSNFLAVSWHAAQEAWAQPAIYITGTARQLLENAASVLLAHGKGATGPSENLVLFVLWLSLVTGGSFSSGE